jgi:hypothetical protein
VGEIKLREEIMKELVKILEGIAQGEEESYRTVRLMTEEAERTLKWVSFTDLRAKSTRSQFFSYGMFIAKAGAALHGRMTIEDLSSFLSVIMDVVTQDEVFFLTYEKRLFQYLNTIMNVLIADTVDNYLNFHLYSAISMNKEKI